MASRYVVGIDLGTTNCALSYVDTEVENVDEARPQSLPLPQVVQPGTVEELPLLPSFLYLPGEKELPEGSLKLPWDEKRDYAVGTFARQQGQKVPTRLVSSAKSWLCHSAVDRRAQILPWQSPKDNRHVSPLEASTYYLKHLCQVWNHQLARDDKKLRLEDQDVILTVPASFDAVARELTVEAAREAGLNNVTLLEEPQAAFYAWIDHHRDEWRERVEVNETILVCDVGGGTTDLTLIAVNEQEGNLELERVAVGDHILLGGDNMDLALAHVVGQQFNKKLDSGQQLMLWHSCRAAKEKLFESPKLTKAPVTVLGRGSKLVGGTLKAELTREEMEQILIDGFLPVCDLDAQPQRQRTVGLQELGLPYATDPALTKHLAAFLSRHQDALAQRTSSEKSLPMSVLFNGGVLKADPIRQRVLSVLSQWSTAAGGSEVNDLHSESLDLAVAQGAAYYGLVRRGKGVRIRGGTARSYYVGIETSLPAVPGAPPPLKALCVVPFGMEEGSEADLPDRQFGLIVGEPVHFRFLGSTSRRDDNVGLLLDDWEEDEIQEMAPLEMTLESEGHEGEAVPVHLHSRVTEVGTLELSCISEDGKDHWKLEFNVREQAES